MNALDELSADSEYKSWMDGKHFVEILEECDLEEGKVYSIINRLSGFFDSIGKYIFLKWKIKLDISNI